VVRSKGFGRWRPTPPKARRQHESEAGEGSRSVACAAQRRRLIAHETSSTEVASESDAHGARQAVPATAHRHLVRTAVTASSAFPGFFPPLLLTAADVGAHESRFPPHLFTAKEALTMPACARWEIVAKQQRLKHRRHVLGTPLQMPPAGQ
jgi:hypothetical protein